MQEITVSTPQGQGEKVARLALAQGLSGVGVARVTEYSGDSVQEKEEVKVTTSAPLSTEFIEAVMSASFWDPKHYSIICDEIMAIVNEEPPKAVTLPMKVPALNVLQTMWQDNHITPAYMGRAVVSSVLVAYGRLSGDMTTLVIAYLFTPFLNQVLAMAFGGWMGDWRLAWQGVKVAALSTVVAVVVGAVVALVMGGPLQYDDFGTVQSNFAISFLVGIIAGLDTVDESGRREFIAVAGAAQFASFPIWFGISLVLGFPDRSTTFWRIATFFVNIVTMLVVSLVTYIALRYRRETVRRYATATHE